MDCKQEGGTGVNTMTTAYAPVCAGTTATGNLQDAGTGLSTSGYVLTSNGASAVPSFQATGAAAGGLVLIATASASNQVTLNFDNKLTSSYNNYFILFNNVLGVTNNAALWCQVGYGGTPTYSAASYGGAYFTYVFNATSQGATPTTEFMLSPGVYSTVTTTGCSGWLNLFNVNDSTNYKQIISSTNFFNVTPNLNAINSVQVWTAANVLTSIRFRHVNRKCKYWKFLSIWIS